MINRILSKIIIRGDINKLNEDALNSFLKQNTRRTKAYNTIKIKTHQTIVKDGGVGVRAERLKQL